MKLMKCECGNTIIEGQGCTECWKSLTVYKTDELCLSDNWERDRLVARKCKVCWAGVPLPRKGYCSKGCASHASIFIKKRSVLRNKGRLTCV